jgi:hypothetical protein
MRFRKIRIAWSVFWGFAALLLIMLRARSQQTIDSIWVQGMGGHANVVSSQDTVRLNLDKTRPSLPPIGYRTLPIGVEGKYVGRHQFGIGHLGSSFVIRVPHWFLIVSLSSLSGLASVNWRFSLRTLLITTTLVAVVLGLMVWVSQAG